MTQMKIHSLFVFKIKTNSDIDKDFYLYPLDANAKWIILYDVV